MWKKNIRFYYQEEYSDSEIKDLTIENFESKVAKELFYYSLSETPSPTSSNITNKYDNNK